MAERGITEALTADHHFEQAGFLAVLKQTAWRQLADAIITADNSLIRSLGREELGMLLT